MEQDKYIVCWVNGRSLDDPEKRDEYIVFMERGSDENYQEALKCYNALLESDHCVSANLCKIEKSTDY